MIEAPIQPQEPVRPKRLPLLLLAVGASLAAGGASAGGAEFLNNTIRRSRDLTDKLNKRVLVTIPYIQTHKEMRRKRGKVSLYIILGLAAFAVGLLSIHLFYTPLDILMLRGMNQIDALI